MTAINPGALQPTPQGGNRPYGKVIRESVAPEVLPSGDTVAWSDLALGRHRPGTGCSYFNGSPKEMLALVRDNWEARKPGVGRSNLDEVVVVPMPSARFVTTTVAVDQDTPLTAKLARRRSHEDPYIRVVASGRPQLAAFANVVLYSKDTLAKKNEGDTQPDWEVVAVLASSVENEPMDPITMMRNMRGKAGGTRVNYTAEQLLDSIEYWSTHAKAESAK